MRYHTETPEASIPIYGETYYTNSGIYSYCTVFRNEEKGFAVIQQYFNPVDKSTKWSSIRPWIANAIYVNPRFPEYFEKVARPATDGIYPTVIVRQAMWALRMKPLKKEPWETVFDRPRV